MAQRFWIGGSGNWSDTAHWAATSGGSGGESVPGATDDVIVDQNSLTAISKTITINAGANIKSLDCSAVNVTALITLSGGGVTVRGNFILAAGMGFNLGSSSLELNNTSTIINITTAGVTLQFANLTLNGDGTTNLLDALSINNATSSARLQITTSSANFIFNTNNNNITCNTFQDNASNVAYTINLGSSTITCNSSLGSNTDVWKIAGTNVIFNAGTSIIVISGDTVDFEGGGKTYATVNLTGTGIRVNSSNIFGTLNITAGKTINFSTNRTQTITTLNALGTSGSNILFRAVNSGAGGTQATLCVTSLNITYVNTQNIIASCGASPFSCFTCVDSGGNVDWTFTDPNPAAPGAYEIKPQMSGIPLTKPNACRIFLQKPIGETITKNKPAIN